MKIDGNVGRVPTMLVEEYGLFREGLRHILADTPYDIQREADSLDSALSLMKDGFAPRLLLLDFNDHDDCEFDAIRALRAEHPKLRIVILTNKVSTRTLAKALEAGVDAYLLKDMSPQALVQSLTLAILGEKVFPTNLARVLIEGGFAGENGSTSPMMGGLSEREVQILRCLVNGDPNKIIADRLKITESTVKVHLKGILRKIHAGNRTQAAIWAVAQGIEKYPLTFQAAR
jgi:two-component system, NarL family, nitrate/nitrite response regulator NarL